MKERRFLSVMIRYYDLADLLLGRMQLVGIYTNSRKDPEEVRGENCCLKLDALPDDLRIYHAVANDEAMQFRIMFESDKLWDGCIWDGMMDYRTFHGVFLTSKHQFQPGDMVRETWGSNPADNPVWRVKNVVFFDRKPVQYYVECERFSKGKQQIKETALFTGRLELVTQIETCEAKIKEYPLFTSITKEFTG